MNFLKWEILSKRTDMEEFVKEIYVYMYIVAVIYD
jgi:hypothetical protein